MVKTPSFKRLILRAVLRQVSPMVIRLVSVADMMPLHEFHDVFRTILGWNGDLGYIVRMHGQEINSFRRKTRSKALHEFKLHRQEKFLYVCEVLVQFHVNVCFYPANVFLGFMPPRLRTKARERLLFFRSGVLGRIDFS